ncbi:MAG: aldehyde dehydrogenase family protein [Thermodesulfobacteriota bacterium]
MPKEFGYLVNGKWETGEKKREIKSPYNGEVAGVINIPSKERALEAISYAEEAFRKFRTSPSHERRRILRDIAEGIEKRKEEFARTLVLEGGKPLKTARVEAGRGVATFSAAADEAGRFGEGELVPMDLTPERRGCSGWRGASRWGSSRGYRPLTFR